jgi:hypothetical protein
MFSPSRTILYDDEGENKLYKNLENEESGLFVDLESSSFMEETGCSL